MLRQGELSHHAQKAQDQRYSQKVLPPSQITIRTMAILTVTAITNTESYYLKQRFETCDIGPPMTGEIHATAKSVLVFNSFYSYNLKL